MKRLLFFFFALFLFSGSSFAQKDSEHWIAPFYDSESSTSTNNLYLSTDSVTPVTVTIYNNNVAIGNVIISKNNPGTFAVPGLFIISKNTTQLFQPISMGLYLEGTAPFFCTLRMWEGSHAEILTSKGKAALGNEFYAVVTPSGYNSSLIDFVTGVIATENNTTVTVSGYDSGVTFRNGWTGTSHPTITFSLNKGQSYIIEGAGGSNDNNAKFIGAKIVSNKPIAVTNGNMNGNFGVPSYGGSDIIMDQSVPTEKLGKMFVMVKGNGQIMNGSSQRKMEEGLVVATVDNTTISVNGGPVLATINEGEFYRIEGINYVNQNNSGHYNMLVETSEPVYLYQLLAGDVDGTDNATLGFNYIPPLNCYLPRKIDEIGFIDEIKPGTIVGDTPNTERLKLNIITETGANVLLNGNPLTAAQGPFPVTGTAGWVTYSIINPGGNATITSNKAVTAGVNGGYGTAGYGGFFAGFNNNPAIMKQSGECIPGIILAVEDGYDTYQWFRNGNQIPGATAFSYTPTIAGDYTVLVTVGSCPPLTTPVYKVFTCTTETTITDEACGPMTFTPTFTNSAQNVVPSTVTIVTQPTNGTAAIDPGTGIVTYTPNAGYLGPDVLVFRFCGDEPEFVDCEEVTVELEVIPFVVTDDTIFGCQYLGSGTFDLTTADINNIPQSTYQYYPTQADLNNGTNEINTPTAYSAAGGSVYVLITTPQQCQDIAVITLEFLDYPDVYDDALSTCYIDAANLTLGTFDLTQTDVTAEPGATFEYYPSLADAENGTNMIDPPTAYSTPSTTVFVKVYGANNCFDIAEITLTVIPPMYSSVIKDQVICIEDRTTLDAGPGFESYEWSTGETTQTISGVGVGQYWVTLGHDGGCKTTQTVTVHKSPDPVIVSVDISNDNVTINVQGGEAPYQYSADGINWQDSNIFEGIIRGENVFYVKDAYDCEPVSVQVTVPNLVNAITPNNDGVNDYIDYSALAYKENLVLSIFDRYGNKVFVADKSNGYRWDGRSNERKVYTGTYWYHIEWQEPNGAKTPVKYTGWILVKNKE